MNDLIQSGGGLAPLGNTDLESGWNIPAPDFLAESQQIQQGQPSLFGQALPAGASVADVQHVVNEITAVFKSDAQKLGLESYFIQAAASWFEEFALRPPPSEQVQHRYNLNGYRFPAGDLAYVHSFLNVMYHAGADQRTVAACLWWVSQLGQAQQPQQSQSPVPSRNSSYSLYDQLDDKTAAYVEARSEADVQTCENILRTRWGNSYQNNVAIVARYVNKLPSQDQRFLHNAIAKDGVAILNDPDVFEELFKQASGISAPSKDVEAEIAEIEKVIGTPEYWKNETLQARYRHLLGRR